VRILTVEDNEEFYHTYLLRMFEKLLPVDKLQFVHTARVAEALELLQEKWALILMDYELPDTVKLALEDGKQLSMRHGNALVLFRREAEKQEGVPRTPIIGMASSRIGNHLLREAGADRAFLKLEVPEIARSIKDYLKL
jgi:CheY-like chemotaxis protein